ncbi:MAG: exodeoxyribonuclease V subunit gamma, partial [Planctomycetaceae bacterium]|nr:exodeoxyribonuclease V subunit gamma [Planctomycetaceae bacterium]
MTNQGSTPGVLEVWLGPSCSGKTTRLLELYREELQSNGRRMDLGRTLWLVPSFRSKQQLLRRMLGENPVCFGPEVRTFEEFAEQILPYSNEPIAPLGTATRHLLLRQIIDELTANETIREYASIAHTRGFTELISSTISELKRNEIWPEHLERITAGEQGRSADRELAAIYDAYQRKLLEHHWYDAEGRFWSAARLLDEENWGRFPEFSMVVVDGFTDFIETQYHLLQHLLGRSERMYLSLPLEKQGNRPDLFARSQRVLERLRLIGPVKTFHIAPEPSAETSPRAIRRIADSLFDNPRTIKKSNDAEGLEIWGLTGPRGEVRHSALRIQELLRQGVPADQIVVGLRDVQGYGDLIDELFTEAGIPFYCESSIPLRRAPLIIALLQLLKIISEDWSYPALLSGLRNDFLRYQWESGEDFVPMLGQFLRAEEITGGRELILDRLVKRVNEASEEDRPPLESLHTDLQRLSELLSATEKSGTWSQWTGRLLHLANEFGINRFGSTRDHQNDASERHAWGAFVETIEGVAETLTLLPANDDRLSLDEFLIELEDLLNVVALKDKSPRTGDVLILDVGEVRHLEVSHLFLLGLTERSFPSRSSENCIYNERDRTALNAKGIRLQLKEQRLQDEMLLFYGITTRARKHLVLSYPHVDSSGEELNCSPYVEALRDLFDPAAVQQITEEHLDPVPSRTQMLGLRDQRIVATAEVLERQPALFAGLIERRDQGDLCRNLAAAVEMNLRRYHDRGFTPYEGMLRNAANRAYLSDHYGTNREFTVSQLEAYAACPFRAFVSETLKITPHSIPGLGTDHLFRGTVLHDLLSNLHLELNRELETGSVEQAGMVDWIANRFIEMVHDQFRSHVNLGGIIGTLREIERDFLLEWAEPYSRQVDFYEQMTRKMLGSPLRPVKFELSFGYDRHSKIEHPPLVLGEGNEQVKLAGRIDRIDECASDELTLYGLIDYKSGSPPKCNDKTVSSGRELQLAVYALAIEQLGLLGNESLLAQVGYWSLREEGFVPSAGAPNIDQRSPDEGWQHLMRTARSVVPKLVLALRNGEFPPYNTDQECTSHCQYKTVCRVNQIRPLEESLDKVWQLALPDANR